MTPTWDRGVIRGSDGPVPEGLGWIVKFGGSILARPRWPDDLQSLLATVSGPVTVVVGGGAIVDGLRALDAASPRPIHVMHLLAIDAMGLTARLVADATDLPLVSEPATNGGAVVLEVPAWLADGGRLGDLPSGWHVTSDSIAALVAVSCHAGLLLAKSVPPPCPVASLVDLANAGWVDDHFPIAAARVGSIHWAAFPRAHARGLPDGKHDLPPGSQTA